ncbi:MAG TPA: hydrogenase subunit MbhD domain-containing protein [Bacillota bacterium]|nr:hydrogenase subunit MbhD domain-containing protein [Bacillota bacterium]
MQFTSIDYFIIVLLTTLVIASLAMYFIKDLLHAVIVFGAYSLIVALIWLLMNTPDLAVTEAAAGICMTVLMMVVIFRTSRREE